MATHLLVRHKVADYAKWRPVFDEHGKTRQASGSKHGHVFRNADNPNEIIVMFEWDSLENARKFGASDDLRKVMERAGVVDKPDVYFLEDTGTVPS